MVVSWSKRFGIPDAVFKYNMHTMIHGHFTLTDSHNQKVCWYYFDKCIRNSVFSLWDHTLLHMPMYIVFVGRYLKHELFCHCSFPCKRKHILMPYRVNLESLSVWGTSRKRTTRYVSLSFDLVSSPAPCTLFI